MDVGVDAAAVVGGERGREADSEPKRRRRRSPHRKWGSAVDPKSGRTYYYNRDTREVQWDVPEDFAPRPQLLRQRTPIMGMLDELATSSSVRPDTLHGIQSALKRGLRDVKNERSVRAGVLRDGLVKVHRAMKGRKAILKALTLHKQKEIKNHLAKLGYAGYGPPIAGGLGEEKDAEGGAAPVGGGGEAKREEDGGLALPAWACEACTFENPKGTAACEICGNSAPLKAICQTCGDSASVDLIGECPHFHCRECLHGYIMGNVAKKKSQGLTCLTEGCACELTQGMIGRILNPAEMDQYLNACLAAFVASDELVFTCPATAECDCVLSFEVTDASKISVPDEIKEEDESGKRLSREAYVHFNQYRLRCRQCNKDFCVSCKAVPYHKGHTCESFKTYEAARHCRFCEEELTKDNAAVDNLGPALRDVCNDEECLEKRDLCCTRVHPCGHNCNGIRDEHKDGECLPCMHEDCAEAAAKRGLANSGEEYCSICFVEDLNSGPCIALKCGHVFHYACALNKIKAKWAGTRITFTFMDCPSKCGVMKHKALDKVLKPHLEMQELLSKKALERLRMDGLDKDDKITNPESDWFGKPAEYAMSSYAFYICFKCKKPYFGGARDCEQNAAADLTPPEQMVCFDCADIKLAVCKNNKHKEYWLWKCRFCCAPAVWFCSGNTHFCDPCHRVPGKLWAAVRAGGGMDEFVKINKERPRCKGDGKDPRECPLKVKHPKQGLEHCLGCGACQEQMEKKKAASGPPVGGGGGGGEKGGGGGGPAPKAPGKKGLFRRKGKK